MAAASYRVALAALAQPNAPSVRAIAEEYGVNYRTLYRRYEGLPDRRVGHAGEQRLTWQQEEKLVKWVLSLERQGFAPTHTQLREMAVCVVLQNDEPISLGVGWTRRFLQRYPELYTKMGRRIDILRRQISERELLLEFFQYYSSTIQDIEPENI